MTFDLFCKVVDNFGDAGVMWRLARALAQEHGIAVRLWIDDLAALRPIAPAHDSIDVRQWPDPFPEERPADVIIEGFGCGIPERFAHAMAARQSLWIVLEYLSAEAWVADRHGLPSPHPRLPIERYFYFPGFVPQTGGLLRERDLLARRDRADSRILAELGVVPEPGTTLVYCFAYDFAPFAELAETIAQGSERTLLLMPCGPEIPSRGALEVRRIPFVPQPRFDELLWAADINFVRGEDSFVRAQWAARPFVWQIYPQAEHAHRVKLEAFLDACAATDEVRALMHAWSRIDGAPPIATAWRNFLAQRASISARNRVWADHLARDADLASKLLRFCTKRVKS